MCFMSTEIDLGLKVDIDNHALCRQHKVLSSISTLKPTSKMLVDLIKFDLVTPPIIDNNIEQRIFEPSIAELKTNGIDWFVFPVESA